MLINRTCLIVTLGSSQIRWCSFTSDPFLSPGRAEPPGPSPTVRAQEASEREMSKGAFILSFCHPVPSPALPPQLFPSGHQWATSLVLCSVAVVCKSPDTSSVALRLASQPTLQGTAPTVSLCFLPHFPGNQEIGTWNRWDMTSVLQSSTQPHVLGPVRLPFGGILITRIRNVKTHRLAPHLRGKNGSETSRWASASWLRGGRWRVTVGPPTR